MHSHVTCKFFTQWFFELQENHFVPFIYFSIHKQCRFKSSCYLQPKRSRPCSRLWLTDSIRYFPGVSRRQRLTCLHGGLAEPGLTGPSGSDLACSKHKVCGGPLYRDRVYQWNRTERIRFTRPAHVSSHAARVTVLPRCDFQGSSRYFSERRALMWRLLLRISFQVVT